MLAQPVSISTASISVSAGPVDLLSGIGLNLLVAALVGLFGGAGQRLLISSSLGVLGVALLPPGLPAIALPPCPGGESTAGQDHDGEHGDSGAQQRRIHGLTTPPAWR